MGKYLALVLVIPLLFSCAARKVAVSKTQTQTYTDSVAVEKKDSISVQQNAIVVVDSTEEIEVTPIDTAKPIIIGETKYFNAKVKVRKIRKRITDSSTIVVAKLTEKQVGVKKEVKQKTFDKKVDKKANYIGFLWLILVLIALWVARKYLLK
jgi:Ulp1 family protease